jgi:tellurite resistance protein
MIDKQKKLSHFQNVALVAAADEALQEIEMEYLVRIGETLGLTSAEMVEAVRSLPENFVIPQTEKEKQEQLDDVLFILTSKADGIHEPEYEACVDFARQLGFSPLQVKEKIEALEKVIRQEGLTE